MENIEKIIKERSLPDVFSFNSGAPVKTMEDFALRREEIKKLLSEYEYGYIPAKPDHLTFDIAETDNNFAAGKATLTKVIFNATIGESEFSFPVRAIIPKSDKKCPAFVFPNFRPDVPDKYLPAEEIVDRGYAVFTFYRNDITTDKGFKSDKLSKSGVASALEKINNEYFLGTNIETIPFSSVTKDGKELLWSKIFDSLK